jgi:putative peptidoglycan lipid II flippase
MSDVKKIAKYSMIVTVILVVTKLIGFVREFLIAVQFGATRESDIFKIASTLPNVLFAAVAAALVTAFIPVFAGIKADREKADKFFNNVLSIVGLLCAFLAVIGMVFAPQLVDLFASGFEGSDFDRTVYMTRILMPSIVFLGISGLYRGYLQSYGVFIQPALTDIAANIVIIAGILIFYKFGIISAIIATFVGAVTQAVVQRPFMKGYKYQPLIDLKDPHARRMMKLGVPTLISASVSQINLMVTRDFASRLAAGSISVVDYATRISAIINQVFIISITTVLYPGLTEKYALGKREEFRDMVVSSINTIIIVVIPMIFGMMALSTPLVKVLLEHGAFDERATAATSSALIAIAFSTLGYSMLDILSKVFYAIGDTVTPMINGFVNVVLNVVLIVFLAPMLGVEGLALSTTVSTNIMGLLMMMQLRKKLRYIKFGKVAVTFAKTLVSGAAMGAVVVIAYKLLSSILDFGNLAIIINITVVTIIGGAIYSGLLFVFKVEESKQVLNMIFKKLKIRK